jgi:hypothetical protein
LHGYCFLHLPSSMHGAFGNIVPHAPCIMHLATVLWANLFIWIQKFNTDHVVYISRPCVAWSFQQRRWECVHVATHVFEIQWHRFAQLCVPKYVSYECHWSTLSAWFWTFGLPNPVNPKVVVRTTMLSWSQAIRAARPSINCHGILIILNHVMWTYYERRWQNDFLCDGSNVIITYNNGVLKALINICPKFFLIQA